MQRRHAYDRGVESGPTPSRLRRHAGRASGDGRRAAWPMVGVGLAAVAAIVTAALVLGAAGSPGGHALPGSTAPVVEAPPTTQDPAASTPSPSDRATPQQPADRWARAGHPQLRVIPPLRDQPDRAAARAKAAQKAAKQAERALARAARRAAASRSAAVSQLLADRAQALLERDEAAFLATADMTSPRVRRTQTRLFRHLAEVPLGGYDYVLRTPITQQAAADPGARSGAPRGAPSASSTPRVWTAQVGVRHRLAGVDGAWLSREAQLRFVRRDGGWRVSAESPLPGGGERRDLWELGRVRAVQGRHSLVLGLTPRSRLRELAGAVDKAVPAVSKVWGHRWSRQVVVLAPETAAQAAALLDRHPDEVGRLAAVTVGRLRQRAGSSPADSADRVVLNPWAFGQLSLVGRRVVLRHEITHVATRSATGPATPMWLSEGFADYVGYQDTRVPVELAAQELLERVRVEGPPARLPANKEFDPGAPQAAAYEAGWLACRVLARLADERGLVRVYRAVGAAESNDRGRALDRALRKVAGTTTARFTARWRAELDALAR